MPEFNFPYSNLEVTQEVNRLPNVFGYLNALNIAPIETKSSRFVRIEMKDGILHVLAAKEPGAPGDTGGGDSENMLIIQIPHFPYMDQILVEDVDSMVQIINGQIEPRSLDRELVNKLQKIRLNHSITLEYIRLGMVKGLIKDGKGRTLYDLYDVFDINKKSVDFALGTPATNIRDKVEEVTDHVISNLKGETSNGVESVVSTSFFNKFISHANYEKFWLQAQNSAEHATLQRTSTGGNWGRVLNVFGQLTLREYKGGMPVKNSSGDIVTEKNVADNKGHAYPTGTQSMMRTFEAPVHHIDMVNEAPAEDTVFVSVETLKHGKGFELESQSNRVAICKQPECLVELTTSN